MVLLVDVLKTFEHTLQGYVFSLMMEHSIDLAEDLVENMEADLLASFEDLGFNLVEDIQTIVYIDKTVLPLVFDSFVLLHYECPLVPEQLGEFGHYAMD